MNPCRHPKSKLWKDVVYGDLVVVCDCGAWAYVNTNDDFKDHDKLKRALNSTILTERPKTRTKTQVKL